LSQSNPYYFESSKLVTTLRFDSFY
jgi:hypothetical protein